MGMVSIVSDLSFTSYTILFQRIESFSLNNSLLHNSHVPFHVFIYFDTQSEWNLSVNHTIPPLSSIELLKLNPASAMFSFSSSRSVVAIELRNSYSYITLTFPPSLCPGNLFLFKNPISREQFEPAVFITCGTKQHGVYLWRQTREHFQSGCECWKCLTKEYLPLCTQTGPMILCVI